MSYEYKVITQAERLTHNLQTLLNELGRDGWRLVPLLVDGCLIFERDNKTITRKDEGATYEHAG